MLRDERKVAERLEHERSSYHVMANIIGIDWIDARAVPMIEA